jgi:hypothetical protein
MPVSDVEPREASRNGNFLLAFSTQEASPLEMF